MMLGEGERQRDRYIEVANRELSKWKTESMVKKFPSAVTVVFNIRVK